MRCTHMYNWKQRTIFLRDRTLPNTVHRIRFSQFFAGLITIHRNARLRMRTTGNRNCPWVFVSLFRTRFMAPAIISLDAGIHLCYWLCAFQVYYGLPHLKFREAWWEWGARESALLPYGLYSVSRVWKTASVGHRNQRFRSAQGSF